MARVEGEIVIGRPVDVVFDVVADGRNEPSYNPGMVSSTMLTPGPVGRGSRFAAVMASRPRPMRMVTEVTGYDRPHRLESRTTAATAEVHGSLTFEAVADGTRMRWSWEVRPTGALRLLGPVIGWVGRRQEAAIWAGLRRYLESGADMPSAPQAPASSAQPAPSAPEAPTGPTAP